MQGSSRAKPLERKKIRYLLSVYQPGGPTPPGAVLDPIMKNVAAVREMKAAGALVLAAGLEPPSRAAVVGPKPDRALVTDGPYAETKESSAASRSSTPRTAMCTRVGAQPGAATTLPIEVRAM